MTAPFTAEDYSARMQRVTTDATAAGLDGLLITPGPELRWLTGYQTTAITERLTVVDALLNTLGILAGVGAGLTVGDLLGVGVTSFEPGAAGLAEVGVTVFGAALAAAGFAFASHAPSRALIAVALVAALGQGVLLVVDQSAVGRTWGPTIAAGTIGAVCYLVAGRFKVPPLTLAAGVLLGQYLAQPVKRERTDWRRVCPARAWSASSGVPADGTDSCRPPRPHSRRPHPQRVIREGRVVALLVVSCIG